MFGWVIIYKIVCKVNGKIYVGITSNSLKDRWYTHISHSKKRPNHPLYLDIRLYGVEAFEITEIEQIKDSFGITSLKKEKYWIRLLQSGYPNGYNLNGFKTKYLLKK